jgi:hypothetical protein
MKHFIKKEFEKIHMPHSCAEEIRQHLDGTQVAPTKKLRSLPRVLIAAALTMCLLLSATAVGLKKGWLDDFLINSDAVTGATELQLTAQEDTVEVSLDRMLTDGPFVYLQVSVRSKGDVNAAEIFEGDPTLPESGIDQRLHFTFAGGYQKLPLSEAGQEKVGMLQLSSQGPKRTWRVTRLDDGSDRNYCSYTMQIILGDLPADYEGLELSMQLNKQRTWIPDAAGSYVTEEEESSLIEECIVLSDAKARVTTTEDGRQVKVHSLGVQIQGADFQVYDANDDWNSGVILQDGRRLSFKPGWSTQDYFTAEMQWNVCLLEELIDPNEVTAIYAGDTIYPLKQVS